MGGPLDNVTAVDMPVSRLDEGWACGIMPCSVLGADEAAEAAAWKASDSCGSVGVGR